MTFVLALGVALWAGAHFFKRVAPDARARMGDKGKGLVTLLLVVSLILMIVGYRGAEYVHLWDRPSWGTGVNNLAMLVAVFLFGVSATTGRLRGRLRHPQLLAVVIWALAHLLVNGDLASVILFGGMLVWALAEMRLINAAGPWHRLEPGLDGKKDILLIVITVVAYIVITGIHYVLGVNPFGG